MPFFVLILSNTILMFFFRHLRHALVLSSLILCIECLYAQNHSFNTSFGKASSFSYQSTHVLGQFSPPGFSSSRGIQNFSGQLYTSSFVPQNLEMEPISISSDYEQVLIEWEAFNDQFIDAIVIYRGTEGTELSEIAKLGPSSIEYKDTDVRNGRVYSYQLQILLGQSLFKAESEIISQFVRPQTITLNERVKFGDHENDSLQFEKLQNYRIIGLPGLDSDYFGELITETFQGSVGENGAYRIFWDNGKGSGEPIEYLDEFKDSEPDNHELFILEPGKAFIALSKFIWPSPLIIRDSTEIDHVLKDTEEMEYKIPIHSGWNLISNPFESPIAWSTINEANFTRFGVPQIECFMQFKESEVGYDPSPFLEPYAGYYFFNDCSMGNEKCPDSLSIPYFPAYGDRGENQCVPSAKSSFFTVYLMSEGDTLSSVYIVDQEKADIEVDPYDVFTPEALSEGGHSLFLEAKRKEKERHKHLIVDARPIREQSDSNIAYLKVQTHNNKQYSLGFGGDFRETNIYLINATSGEVFTANNSVNYSVPLPSNLSTSFEIVIEPTDESTENIIEDPDSDLEITHYPNPSFGEGTFVIYTKKPRVLSLDFYDSLGRKVESFFTNNFFSKGRHTINFTQLNLAGGLYFYTLSSNEVTLNGKIVIIR